MTDKLGTFIQAACEIADALRSEEQTVPIAMLKRFLPRASWSDDEEDLRRLELVLDAVGIALERSDAKQARLRRRSRDTGTMDQAVRTRDGFREKLFGPKEHVSKGTLLQLASFSRAGTTDAVGALGEALEAAGFKSLGDWATKWNRHRLIIPGKGVDLVLGRPTLRLAKLRRFTSCSPVPGDGLLFRYFPEFKNYTCAGQRNAVHAIVNGDGPAVVIANLPTGSGKSLLYLLPSAEWRGLGQPATSLVISPVIALQNDQVRKIQKDYRVSGLKAAELNSTVSVKERTSIYRRLRSGDLDVLFLAPEKLVDPFFQQVLIDSAKHLRLFVVDEAHIVADWGQDFRTDFFRLGVVRNRLLEENPRLQTLLLSATLTAESESTVLRVFHNPEPIVRFDEPSFRKELSIRVIRHRSEAEVDDTLIGLLHQLPRPCIIYCARRDHVRKLRKMLRQKGIRRFMDYMGSTPPDSRRERLKAFHDGDVDFVLATNAFGLGVDKANVRSVIHYDVPSSLDEYYQQIGRAARDHQTGHTFLLYSPSSMRRSTKDKRAIIKTETAAARARTMLDEREELPCDGTGRCLLPLHALPEHITQPSELNRNWNFAVLNILEQCHDLEVDRAVLRRVWVNKGSRPERLDQYPRLKKALRTALRKNSGREVDLAASSIDDRVSFSELERELVRAVLASAVELIRNDQISEQEREEWVLVHRHGSRTWTPLHSRRLDENRNERFKLAEKQRRQLQAFLSAKGCRMQAIARVYGHRLDRPCGHCDKCDSSLSIEAGDLAVKI